MSRNKIIGIVLAFVFSLLVFIISNNFFTTNNNKTTASNAANYNKASSVGISSPYDFSKSNRILTQTHCHSTNSGGLDTPQQLIENYYNRGYRALAITDHDLITWPWPISPDSMVALEGNELTSSWHMSSLCNNYLRGSETNPQTWINEINSRDGVSIINHPARSGKSCNDLKSLTGYTGIEIYNYRSSGNVQYSLELWDCLLSTYKKNIWGIASDDYHGGAENIDHGKIMILSNSYTEPEVKNALKTGNFYAIVGNNNLSFQNISISGLTLTVTTNIPANIKFIGNNGTTFSLLTNRTEATYNIQGTENYIRIEASASGSTIYSNPISIDRVHPNGTLVQVKSPYSPTDPAIYRIEGGQKRHIPDPYVFNSQFSWSKVVAISTIERDSYADGTVLPFRDGELVKEQSNPAIYVFEGGQKRHIVNPITFNAYGYSASNVLTVADNELNQFPTGSDLTI